MVTDLTSKVAENLIEIRVNDIAQLFHTLDPFPFRERDLADEAEDYIVSWARETAIDPSSLWCIFQIASHKKGHRVTLLRHSIAILPVEPSLSSAISTNFSA